MVELNTKLWLTNGLLFVNFDSGGNNKLLRLFIGLLISLGALTAQLMLRPFRKKTDDAIASVVRLMVVLFFVLGIMIKLCDKEGASAIHNLLDAKVDDSCYHLVGVIAGAMTVQFCMLIAALLVVLVPVSMLVRQLFFSKAVPILRLASTGEPPVVLLRKGERYHMFLSHIWSTGQDQCAIIKRQLQLLMPGVIIFLDGISAAEEA